MICVQLCIDICKSVSAVSNSKRELCVMCCAADTCFTCCVTKRRPFEAAAVGISGMERVTLPTKEDKQVESTVVEDL